MAHEAAELSQRSDSDLLGVLKEAARCEKWDTRNAVLGEFYRRYAEDLVRTWRRRTDDSDAASEILQETFTRAILRLPAAPADQDVLIWLRTTARNYWMDRKRHEVVERRHFQSRAGVLGHGLAAETEDRWIAELDRDKTRVTFERYLTNLSSQDREVIALRIGGMQSPGICGRLGISEPECHRAYARIRFLLQKMRMRGFTLQTLPVGDLMAAAQRPGGAARESRAGDPGEVPVGSRHP